ncbi:MAG: hypothetical protein EA349_03190 [Halomonadaceae bacterium]|nr:MAG: hypothetical protein EA349_03190 [Halomonadaceae bacterium]
MAVNHGPATKSYRGWLLAGASALLLSVLLLEAGAPWLGVPLLVVALYCGRRWQQGQHARLEPGDLTLSLSPDPGALQGDVAGCLQSDNPILREGQLYFRLRCIRVQERYRGQVIEHRKQVCWQGSQPAFIDPESPGEEVRLYFQFSPPAGLAPTENKPELRETVWQHYHYWELTLSGVVASLPLSPQHFRPRVSPGEARAGHPLPEAYQVQAASKEAPDAEMPQALWQRLALVETDDGLSLQDGPPPRGAAAAWALAGAGVWWLFTSLWLAAPVLLWALWLAGRNGQVLLRPGHVMVIRQWFGRGIYARNAPLTEMAQLQLAPRLLPPLFSGGEPRYRLRLLAQGKQVLLMRDLRSQQEGEQLCRYLRVALQLT